MDDPLILHFSTVDNLSVDNLWFMWTTFLDNAIANVFPIVNLCKTRGQLCTDGDRFFHVSQELPERKAGGCG